MKENLTPEERLLRLIKGEKKQKPPPDLSGQKTAISPDSKPAAKIAAQVAARGYRININRLIPVFFGASVIYLLVSFIYSWIGLKEIKLPDVSEEELKELQPKAKEEPRPYEFYSKGVSQHQIFGSPTGNAKSQDTPAPAVATDTDLIKNISLVGIISGLNPQAIIEDKKAQKTYYLTKGQALGEIQVEDILEGKIIINYQGNRFELYL